LTYMVVLYCIFFFQAEDGIRVRDVTGVQTCALPIDMYILGNSEHPTFKAGSCLPLPKTRQCSLNRRLHQIVAPIFAAREHRTKSAQSRQKRHNARLMRLGYYSARLHADDGLTFGEENYSTTDPAIADFRLNYG